ncbi:hypothetical protein LPC08_10645 [Roseomonas sp. OT10]|uniref:hypothetical protein n=1 Tax=Roseomonas cutis TaxID=2897332 RepID=UPI001E59E651|nr:hypothetical protein [Roseomonas sp. OT10]UFN51027.1 hypothetical protein LPC08_10645 [Roseomonas sp. OT10]
MTAGAWRAAPLLLALCGCQALPQVTGAVTAIASGGVTANPAVGLAVGVVTTAATDVAVKYYGRSRQDATQQAIAEVAGPLPSGRQASWRIRHSIPIGNEHGEVAVVRDIPNPLAPCREIVFSVADGEEAASPRLWFASHICRQAGGWRWASVEPAVERWGSLH